LKSDSVSKLRTHVLIFLIFFFWVIILRVFVFQVFLVTGNSMLPTLRNGDLVLVSKIGFPVSSEFFPWEFIYSKPILERLDILIFEDQENELNLKRVVGMPGEYYEINYGKVMIDSRILEENYVSKGQETSQPDNKLFYKFPNSPFLEMQSKGRIPPNYFLLLGDNRENSTDSRSMGLVPLHKLRGKVIAYYRL